jgi:hypothetical protein
MFRRSLHLVLVLGLAASPALSAASTPWSVILFDLLHRPGQGIQAKAGCTINPDGQPLCQKRERRVPRPVRPKHGCSINPDGQTFCQP